MGSATASLVSERLQALAQLNSAFGQPDGSLFFTFDGALYQSMGVNADDTLRVLNVNTGQITASLDPVDIYSAVRAAAGNPLPPPQPPSSASALGPHGPSMMSNMMGKVGMYSTFLNMGYQIKGVKTILNNIPKFGVALGSVTTFLSAYQAFRGVQSLYKNGFSIGGLLNLAGSAFGIATGVNTLVGTLQGSGLSVLTNPAGWAVAGAVISASSMHAGISDLITNGFSAKGLLTAGLGFVGTVGFTHVALVAMFGMASMGVAIAIAAVVALLYVALPVRYARSGW